MSQLANEPVFRTFVRMAVPMLAGTFAMNMYQLANVWFVSRLGTDDLAAISFTFPVVMVFMLVTRGLGMGSLTLVAHALGAKDTARAARLTMHALCLALIFSFVLSISGMLTIEPLFKALGASGDVLRKITAYMRIWYLGSAIMVLQMLSSDIIVGTGNTKVVSILMVGGTVINIFFDIGLIFGHFGMPAIGIAGAAVATLISQAVTLCGSFLLLRNKFGLIQFSNVITGIIPSWIKIFQFSAPGALGLAMTPAASAVITKLIAKYGTAAVAASGVASRIEMFAFMIPMSVGMSLIPFIAQNYGAGRMDRIYLARKGTMMFAVLYGILLASVFVIFAEPLAGFFSDERAVKDVLKLYIYITCGGYGMLEVHRYAGFCMTGTGRPLRGSILNIIRIVVFLIPLSILGSTLFQIKGIFFGRLITDIAAGFIGIWWSEKILKSTNIGAPSNKGREFKLRE